MTAAQVGDQRLELLLAFQVRNALPVLLQHGLDFAQARMGVAQAALGQGFLGALGKGEGQLFRGIGQRLRNGDVVDALALEAAAGLLRGGVGRFPRREGRGGGTLEDVHRGCGSWSAKAAQYRNRPGAADANIGRFFLAAAATDF